MSTGQEDLELNEMMRYFSGLKRTAAATGSFVLRTAAKYWLLLTAAVILSAGAGWYKARHQRPYYDVRMSCSFNDNHQKIFGEMLARVNTLLQTGSRKEAAQLLDLSEEEAGRIASLEGKTLTQGKLEDDFSDARLPFYVDARVYDRELIPVLEQHVLKYLNGNDLSSRELAHKRQKWQDRIIFYKTQLLKLDSLKEAMRQSYTIPHGAQWLPEPDAAVVHVYKLSDSLAFQLEDVEYYNSHYETVSKVYGFAAADHPVTPSAGIAAVRYGLAGLLIMWILLILMEASRAIPRKPVV